MATQISTLTTLNNNTGSYNCFIPIVDPNLALDSRNLKIRFSTHNEMFSNNFAVGNLSSYGNYFGTGADGSVTVSSSAQISSSTSPARLNNTQLGGEFGDIIVKNFQDLTINSGVFYSPLRACRGLVIYCTGNLTVDGTVSITGKGGGVGSKIAAPIGFCSSTDTRFDLIDATLYFNNLSSSISGKGIPTHWNWAPSGSDWFSNYKIRVPLSGSVAGGAGATSGNGAGSTGTTGIFCCGGGGGGGAGQPQYAGYAQGGAGGRGTIFSGGAGGGGGGGGYTGTPGGTALLELGGNGGDANPSAGFRGGGGAGNPAGTNTPGSGNGSTGVGGTIVFIVRGNFTNNGTISANGRNGGAGGSGGAAGGGGGGSGGGCILIVFGGTYTNTGTVVANGGSGGAAGGPSGGGAGGSGGAGSIRVRKVHI